MNDSPKSACAARPALPSKPSRIDGLLRGANAFVAEWLVRALPGRETPPLRLHAAMHDAVFPGGRRARPLLCRLVADCHGRGDDELVGRLAAAIELIHCASLVQDDLPCFDDAATRRGRPAGHLVYGEATAILAGDALLALAFETLAAAPLARAKTAYQVLGLLTAAAGSVSGIIGGQALELEPYPVELERYHRHKTAALFRVAAAGGALISGATPAAVDNWARIGELVGAALQLRDDLDDVSASASELGKPVGRDAQLGRPNAAIAGLAACRDRQSRLIEEIHERLGPPSPATEALRLLVEEVTRPAALSAAS